MQKLKNFWYESARNPSRVATPSQSIFVSASSLHRKDSPNQIYNVHTQNDPRNAMWEACKNPLETAYKDIVKSIFYCYLNPRNLSFNYHCIKNSSHKSLKWTEAFRHVCILQPLLKWLALKGYCLSMEAFNYPICNLFFPSHFSVFYIPFLSAGPRFILINMHNKFPAWVELVTCASSKNRLKIQRRNKICRTVLLRKCRY